MHGASAFSGRHSKVCSDPSWILELKSLKEEDQSNGAKITGKAESQKKTGEDRSGCEMAIKVESRKRTAAMGWGGGQRN